MVMWIIAAVVIQLQKYRKQTEAQEEYRRSVQLQFERQRTQLQVIDEVTRLLQDSINNPLAIISVTCQNLRRRFENDNEVCTQLDRIDISLQRVHTTINDIKAYQTQRIVQDSLSMHEQQPNMEDVKTVDSEIAANPLVSDLGTAKLPAAGVGPGRP
jgi:signal transduction histidine kinase